MECRGWKRVFLCGSCEGRSFRAPLLSGVLVFLWAFFVSFPCAGASSPEEMLFSHMEKIFTPESMEMILDAPVEPDGSVRRMFLRIQGASFSGFRVEEIVGEFTFLCLPPVKDWGLEGEHLEVVEALGVYFTARVLEEDINSYLLGKTLHLESSQWRDVRCHLFPEGIHAAARADLMLSGNVRAVVDLKGTFRLREGNQVFLEDTVFSVNGGEKEIGAVEEALREMQPIIDFRELPFPVRVHSLTLSRGSMDFATRIPPKTFSGFFHRSLP